jgi:hypothetical protein
MRQIITTPIIAGVHEIVQSPATVHVVECTGTIREFHGSAWVATPVLLGPDGHEDMEGMTLLYLYSGVYPKMYVCCTDPCTDSYTGGGGRQTIYADGTRKPTQFIRFFTR